MRLYSPVNLTDNVNIIETFVLGVTGTGDLPPLRHQVKLDIQREKEGEKELKSDSERVVVV